MPRKRYKLVAFMIFGNHAPYLKEWIEFHRLMGVEHFYLYNHFSQDNYMQVLRDYIRLEIVTLTSWSIRGYFWTVQRDAIRNCIRRFRNASDWFLVLDIDEFLFPKTANNIPEVLDRLGWATAGLSVPSNLFGFSGHKIQTKGLIIENYTKRAPSDYGLYKQMVGVKSVYKTSRILYCGNICTHYVYTVPPLEKDTQHFQLNHYWTRSEEEFFEYRKLQPGGVMGRSLCYYNISCDDKNWQQKFVEKIKRDYTIEDNKILRFLPQLKARLNQAITP